MTSRASAGVLERSIPRPPGRASAPCLNHSAPVLVLPQPLPARTSQAVQSPSGASCFSRAQCRQSYRAMALCSGVNPSSTRALAVGGRDASAGAFRGDRSVCNRSSLWRPSPFPLRCASRARRSCGRIRPRRPRGAFSSLRRSRELACHSAYRDGASLGRVLSFYPKA